MSYNYENWVEREIRKCEDSLDYFLTFFEYHALNEYLKSLKGGKNE